MWNNEKKPVYKEWWFWLVIVWVSIVATVIVSNSDTDKTNNVIEVSETPKTVIYTQEPKIDEIYEVDYNVLFQDYQDNPINADAEYKGKILKLTGQVYNIDREISGNPYVTFNIGGNYSIKNIRLTFKKSEEEKITQLSKGQSINV